MSEKMQNDKAVKKGHRAPAAAVSVIAFASANAFFKRDKKDKRASTTSTNSTEREFSSADHFENNKNGAAGNTSSTRGNTKSLTGTTTETKVWCLSA
jgi:hypothetical protein